MHFTSTKGESTELTCHNFVDNSEKKKLCHKDKRIWEYSSNIHVDTQTADTAWTDFKLKYCRIISDACKKYDEIWLPQRNGVL
jgi:hypothetical protein